MSYSIVILSSRASNLVACVQSVLANEPDLPPERIVVGEALAVLGGRFFDPEFCQEHTGIEKMCTNTVDCSIRSLWRTVQLVVDRVLAKTTLKDLVSNEQEMTSWVGNLVNISDAEKQLRNQLTLNG